MKKIIGKMRKAAAGAITAALILSMSATAFAADAPNITKTYSLGTGSQTTAVSPAETFTLTFTKYAVYNAGAAYSTTDSIPDIDAVTIAAAAGDAGKAGVDLKSDITLPTYTTPGDFWYEVAETAGTTTGVTYDSAKYYMHVQVTYGTGADAANLSSSVTLHKTAPTAQSTSGSSTSSADKVTGVTNSYSAGDLAVKKVVAGNAGDKDKRFKMTVTFTNPTGKTMASTISYTAATAENGTASAQSIAPAAWSEGTATAVIYVKDDETVTFSNVPFGVTYTVTEDDYSSAGYTAETVYSDATNKLIDSASDTVTITNTKTAAMDVGVVTKNAPYLVIIALAAMAFAVFFRRRRGNGEY